MKKKTSTPSRLAANLANRFFSWLTFGTIGLLVGSLSLMGFVISERATTTSELIQIANVLNLNNAVTTRLTYLSVDPNAELTILNQETAALKKGVEQFYSLDPEARKTDPILASSVSSIATWGSELAAAPTSDEKIVALQHLQSDITSVTTSMRKITSDLNSYANILNFWTIVAFSVAGITLLLTGYLMLIMRSTISAVSNWNRQVIESFAEPKKLKAVPLVLAKRVRWLPGAQQVADQSFILVEKFRILVEREQLLTRAQGRLTTKAQKANAQLIAAREEVYRAAQLAGVGKIAGSISHEINNPVTGVLGYIAYARKHIKDEKVITYLIKATNEVERIGRIAKALLVFSRHTATQQTLPFDVSPTVENVAILVEPQFSDALVTLVVKPSFNLPAVLGRNDEFQQSLLNLLLNAKDAARDSKQKKVFVEISRVKNSIEVAVTDTGAGVPQAFREFLFQPFHTTKPVGQGSGLGLAVARELMQRMGGTVSFDSKFGPGARFVLSLPIATKKSISVAEESQKSEMQAEPKSLAKRSARAKKESVGKLSEAQLAVAASKAKG